MKHLKLFEGAARRKYSEEEVAYFKKITEFCEEYVQDILDDCKSEGIIATSYTTKGRNSFEWIMIIKSYYPINIDSLTRKMSSDFEVKDWWIESSGTSRATSETENKTKLTLSLVPKF